MTAPITTENHSAHLPAPRSYCRTKIDDGTTIYYANFAAVRSALGLPARYTETAFAAQLDVPRDGYIWKRAFLPLPTTNHNTPVPNPNFPTPVWWSDWNSSAPVAASQFMLPDTLEQRKDIAERNLYIRVGIARDNFLHKDELFPVPSTEVEVEEVRGIRVCDGTNTYETNLGELMQQTHWTLNWYVLRAICDGAYGGYVFELSDAAKDALNAYLACFARDTRDPNTCITSFAASDFLPIEQYNRFGEIEFCFGSLQSAVTHTNLSAFVLRRKIDIWDSTTRSQYRFACPQTPATTSLSSVFPICQWRENTPINYFATYAEAASVLGCGTSTISRWCATGTTDIFGCTWTREKA